jgi:hypothetical protein
MRKATRGKKRTRKPLAPEARERAIIMYSSLIEDEMRGMVKAESHEEQYAKLRAATRALTEQDFKDRARRAAEYFVDHANPAPTKLTKAESDRLLADAIKHALTNPST